MIWWTSLAPWEFEFPFPGSLTSTFLVPRRQQSVPQERGCPFPGDGGVRLCSILSLFTNEKCVRKFQILVAPAPPQWIVLRGLVINTLSF